ncbi:hypothetical protein EV651_12575 [Kribbella sp. VKM Ac-2571]|nr:hypothetical protein EV651_12575 [Kribbella sp. VKM Ac-2571]
MGCVWAWLDTRWAFAGAYGGLGVGASVHTREAWTGPNRFAVGAKALRGRGAQA